MKRALIRFAAVAASCCLLAGCPALRADAATPVPPINVITITIPSPDQVLDTGDGTFCLWRMAYAGLADAPDYAPLAAALCRMFGS